MNFKQITIEDQDIFNDFLTPYTFQSCEYTFINLYIWREGCDIQYTVLDDTLIIKKTDFDGSTHFMQPVKYKESNIKEIVDTLIKYKEDNSITYLFGDVEESFVTKLESLYPGKFTFEEDRNNFDYVYDSEKLISLSGKVLHKKKSHYNYFVKNYEYKILPITKEVRDDVIAAANCWCLKNDCIDFLAFECKAIESLLMNIDRLNFQGIVIYIKDKVAAFTIGEKANDKMAVIHIEKADDNYRGLYNFINKTFVEMRYSDVPFINREQDLGLEGLRQAKTSYEPLNLVKKFKVK